MKRNLHTIRLTRIRSAALVAATTVALAGSGCSSRRPLAEWRGTVERYLDAGGGDPAALRALPGLKAQRAAQPARIDIGVLDVPGPIGRARDVQGVLVGTTTWHGRTWYVFLVGTTERSGGLPRRIMDMRIIAFRDEPAGPVWVTGDNARAAIRRYLAMRRSQSEHPAFPGRADAFTLASRGTFVIVTERASGAEWTLDWTEERQRQGDHDVEETEAVSPPSARLPAAGDDVALGGEFLEPHRPVGVDLRRADADFRAEPELEAVVEARARVGQHAG